MRSDSLRSLSTPLDHSPVNCVASFQTVFQIRFNICFSSKRFFCVFFYFLSFVVFSFVFQKLLMDAVEMIWLECFVGRWAQKLSSNHSNLYHFSLSESIFVSQWLFVVLCNPLVCAHKNLRVKTSIATCA